MADDLVKRIRVFVASPGDVILERDQLPKVIQEINLVINAIAPEKKIILDLIRWETNAYPGLGEDAQDVINKQLPEYDIFIGIMWKRFGTPTSRAGSGTEEEFNKAFEKWENNNLPVLFYFCQKLIAIPNTEDEIEQLKNVIRFKESLQNKGLIWEYNDHTEFGDIMRPHLVMTLSKLLTAVKEAEPKKELAVNILPKHLVTEHLTSESDISIAQAQVTILKNEYEDLRKNMRAGNERTRQMAVIESKMRSMAFQLSPMVAQLVNSPSSGERLAAIATLKEIPNPLYLGWLANRVGDAEKQFVGYNASLGLLAAVRILGWNFKSQLTDAYNIAMSNYDKAKRKDPNQEAVLKTMKIEIEKLEAKLKS